MYALIMHESDFVIGFLIIQHAGLVNDVMLGASTIICLTFCLLLVRTGTSTNDDMPEELGSTSRYNFINKMKTYMIWFLRTHGFYGVLIMASYPNIAFDLCGICCGHFLMPFWTFFGATFIGKAVIRNGYQSIIYVMLCR